MKLRIDFRSKSLEEREAWLSQKFHGIERSVLLLWIAVIAYSIVFSCITILRHYSFMTRAWDMGIFTQSLWTTLYANKFLYHTCELFINPSGSFFGVHFSPILLLVLPLYRLITAPEVLFVLQSFILAIAAVPVYRLAREHAGGRIVGLLFASAYLMYPPMQLVNWYDFHVQAFLPLFFGFAMYYITKENWPRYFLFFLLSLMVEEHAAWLTTFIGVYIAWKYRRPIISTLRNRESAGKKALAIAVTTIMISGAWYWFTIWQRNTFFPTNPAAIEEFLGAGNLSILGAKDPLQIPLLVITRPWNAVQALAYDSQYKLLYLALLFGPLALFSFKAPSALIPTIPWFGFSFVSQTMAHHTLGNQYQAYLVAFIFFSAIFGLQKNFLKSPDLKSIKGSLRKIIAFNLVFFFLTSPLCPVLNIAFPDYTRIGIGSHEQQLNEVLRIIPPNASILTQDNLFTQISHRVDAYVISSRHLQSAIKDLVASFINETLDYRVEYVLVDNKTDAASANLAVSLLQTRPQFKLIMARDGNTILLYQRKP